MGRGQITSYVFHSSNIFTSVGGEIQSLAWDPTGERLAVLLKGLFHPDEPNQYCYIFIPGFNNSPFLPALSGDPHATDRPAIIAVFKTRSRPIFELLPWFAHELLQNFSWVLFQG